MNPVLLQKQLRENANDLQDFYKDLQNWGDEMKRKDECLKGKGDTIKKPKVQAAPDASEIKDVPRKKNSKIGSTDYAKWEKYDADMECERLEDDFKEDSELTDEFEESASDEAIVHKDKGNSYVKMKEWDKAIDCYTKAINCYSYDPIFYANRALCYLKKNSYIAAEEDCTLSLRLDSTYVKALQRRASARESLGKLREAEGDLEIVLTHEPKNKESLAALERIRKRMGIKEKTVEDEQRPVSKFTASRNKAQPVNNLVDISSPITSSWPDPGCNIIPVKAINKPPHIRSQEPLKRIEITEIDSFSKKEEPSEGSLEAPEAFKKHVVEHVKHDEIVIASEPVEKISAFKKKREKTKNDNNEAWLKTTSSLQNNTIRCEDLKVLEKKPLVEHKLKEKKNTENICLTKMDNKIESKQIAAGDSTNKDFAVPKTSVQFYNTWKSIKTADAKYKYLKLIDPQEIPKIFQESLESNVFSGILDVLSTSFVEKEIDVYDYLFQLTQVKRFSALAMFMDSTDKNRLWKMITYLKEQNRRPKEQIDNLALEYEL